MRLIDADALIERLDPYKDKYGAEEFPYHMVHDAFIYEIGKEPAVDAIPMDFINSWYDRYKLAVVEVQDLIDDWNEVKNETHRIHNPNR